MADTGELRQPHEYPRRVLFAVTGLSPQVITESCYALAVARGPAWLPTEIQVLTTGEGADRVRHTLLSREPGWFRRFLREYELPPITFGPEQIHVVHDGEGRPLEDIRDAESNIYTADAITDLIRDFTADEDCALHVSIAGGRKTMGFFAGYALSLYGRPQDRLSHVLVSAPYEGNQDFFYPSRESRILYTHPPENRPIDAAEAQVSLACIPFVRLRHGIPRALKEGRGSYSEVVEAAQRALGPLRLHLDPESREVIAGAAAFTLPPVEFAFLSWFARRAVNGESPLPCPVEGVPDETMGREYLRELEELTDPEDSRTGKRLQKGMDREFFEQTRSRLMRSLKEHLGPEGAQRYGIRGQGRPKLYWLDLPPDAIGWEGQL